MRTSIVQTSIVAACAAFIGLAPLAARAEDASTKTPAKSERAMSPDSAKAGASPGAKSERAMDPAAGKPGSAPNGKSERAMDPKSK